ncbi:MAG: S-methyl-5-thioribose-1-phosphate isomerase [Actinomycetota bacterium]
MKPIAWRDNVLVLLDQTKLPAAEEYLNIDDYREVARAIKELKVRGAPAIGVAAAFGLALAALTSPETDIEDFNREMQTAADELASTRPTAVNLFAALDRVLAVLTAAETTAEAKTAVVIETELIFRETERADKALAGAGAALIDDGDTILTICNTGALATGAYGTALGVIRSAYESGKEIKVIACETRPLLQGARLTMWELDKYGIPAELIVDSAAGYLLSKGRINKVITGADRIAANGDTANKIGTYTLACLAERHDVPFYIAAPVSTIDLATPGGEHIEVEERSAEEVLSFGGTRIAPPDAEAINPAFDITPAGLITSIITDQGIVEPPYKESLAAAKRAASNTGATI